MMAFTKKLIMNEPVMVVTIIGVILNGLMVFGIPISEAQKTAILVPVDLILAVVARQMVTPTGKFNAEVNEEAANIAKAALDAPSWGDLEAELKHLELKARLKEAQDASPEV
jgi:hypothetical protein